MQTAGTQSMWAYALTAPGTLTLVDAPAPNVAGLRDGQVLLRVMVGGICGSDLPFFRGNASLTATPGTGAVPKPSVGAPMHEVVGEVVGSRDASLPLGAFCVGWATGMNALAELIVVDGRDLLRLPAVLPATEAIMLQPLACVLYASDVLSGIEGCSAAVIGQGPIGLLFSHVLKDRGAASVTGLDRVDRSDVGHLFGVDEVAWSTSDRWASSFTSDCARPSVVVEAVGHQVSTLTHAITALRDGGQIYYFGIPDDPVYPMPMAAFLRKNGRLYSGYTPAAAHRDSLARAAQYLRRYPDIVKPYLSHPYPFSQAQQAFTAALTPRVGQLKVTLEV